MNNIKVPFVSFKPLETKLNLTKTFERILKSSRYIDGKEDEAFEKSFSNYIGTRHCIGCGNGLDALVLSLRHWDLEKEMRS